MKETFYFSHDYNASMNEKLIKLQSKHGMTGYGIFWRIVENLYNNENELSLDYDRIAYDLHISECKIVESIINDFGLFIIGDGFFGSESIERRLDERSERSEKARQKAYKRWRKEFNNDASALKSDAIASKTDAGKDRIGTDRKKTDSIGVGKKRYEFKNSRKSGKKNLPDPNQEQEEEIQNLENKNLSLDTFLNSVSPFGVLRTEESNRARAHVMGTGLESENFNYNDMIGDPDPDKKRKAEPDGNKLNISSVPIGEEEQNKPSERIANEDDW